MLTERHSPRRTVAGVAAILEAKPREPTLEIVRLNLGHMPVISVLSAVGFALVAVAFYASRRQLGWAEPPFWIGMVLIAGAPLVRLLAASPSRAERIGLVLVLTIGLYLVKVAYSPVAFTFPDELAHDYNVRWVLQTGHLFQPNPVLAITPLYPALSTVTAAVASTTGLPDFHSGLLVSGVARILLVLGLFFLVERLTLSARMAGLVAALYTANPNYLFYSAEFGYESLALPLSGLVLLAAVRRDAAPAPGVRTGWTVLAILAGLCVVITHHLTSYALVGALWAMVGLSLVTHGRARPAPWDLAVIVTLGVAAWFALVASSTWLYLSAVLGPASLSLLALLTRQQAPRQVFDPAAALGTATPVWQEAFAFGSILLIAIGLPVGVLHWWRGSRRHSLALLLGLAGLVYIPVQVLRLTPASWETANRSSEFLFAGVAFLLGLAVTAAQPRSPEDIPGWLRRVGLAAYILVIFLGGVVVSWRPDLRLPRAYETLAAGRIIEPEGVVLADWAPKFLGVNNSIATDESNAMLLATYGEQDPWSGSANGIRSMLGAPTVDPSVRTILAGVRARYVVLDRRLQSADHLVGIYPLAGPGPAQPGQLVDPTIFAKFDAQPEVSRIADTGNIVVYDVSRLSGVNASP